MKSRDVDAVVSAAAGDCDSSVAVTVSTQPSGVVVVAGAADATWPSSPGGGTGLSAAGAGPGSSASAHGAVCHRDQQDAASSLAQRSNMASLSWMLSPAPQSDKAPDDQRFNLTGVMLLPIADLHSGCTVQHASGAHRGDGKTDAKDAVIIADQARMRSRRDLHQFRHCDKTAVDLPRHMCLLIV
jgi:hypothetical protein